jgi:selenocysteine-specific elongation factor
MVAATPGSLMPGYMLDCDFLYLASSTKPLKHRARVRVHLGTVEVMGRISLLDRDVMHPGEIAGVQLLLEEPVSCWPGDRYVVRSYSPVATIGGGEVLGNMPPRKRKRLNEKDREKNRAVFQILYDDNVENKIILFLRERGAAGLNFDELAIRLGTFSKQLKKLITVPLSSRKIVVVDSASQRYLDKSITDSIELTLQSTLEAYHRDNPLQVGLSKEELRSGLGRNVDAKVFQFCFNELQKKGIVVQEESAIRLATHQVALQADEKKLQKDLIGWYQRKGLKAPTIRETMDEFSDYPESLVKEVFGLLLREEKLVKVSETLYFDAAVITVLQKDVCAFIEKEGEIDAPRFKNLTGLTRKFSIPLLEYFDRIKLTIRVGDKRIFRG